MSANNRLFNIESLERLTQRGATIDPAWLEPALDQLLSVMRDNERLREAAQNLINTFKVGDDMVKKDGVKPCVANAIATTALHQLEQALRYKESE